MGPRHWQQSRLSHAFGIRKKARPRDRLLRPERPGFAIALAARAAALAGAGTAVRPVGTAVAPLHRTLCRMLRRASRVKPLSRALVESERRVGWGGAAHEGWRRVVGW